MIKKDGFSETERGVHTLYAKRRDAKKWHVREKNGVIIRLFCKNVSQMEDCSSSGAGFCFLFLMVMSVSISIQYTTYKRSLQFYPFIRNE